MNNLTITSEELHHLIQIGVVRIATKQSIAPKISRREDPTLYMREYREHIRKNRPEKWKEMLAQKAEYMRNYRRQKQTQN